MTDAPPTAHRLAFGLEALDAALGGGLRPGTLTVIAGATGIGKTQLGLAWANHGAMQEQARGVVVDVTSRGDSQNHEEYGRQRYDWDLRTKDVAATFASDALWDFDKRIPDIYRPFATIGRRVTRPDLDPDAWDAWKRDMARVLRDGAGFLYSHFVRGTRRVVFDGVEPSGRAADSAQFEFIEYLYERVIRQEHDWAAREVLRELYRAHAERVESHAYAHTSLGTVVLYTTHDVMLDDLMTRPIGQGDLVATANTMIVMGRVARDGGLGRGLCVTKHRGSACSDEVLPFRIETDGVQFG